MNALRMMSLAFGLSLLLSDGTVFAKTLLSQNLPPLQNNSGYQTGSYTSPDPYGNYTQVQSGQYNYTNSQPSSPLRGYVMTAPAGSVVSAMVSSAISSEYARVGDRFIANLGSPLMSGGSIVLPAGSQMEGQVVMAQAAGRTGRNGELDIRFTSAILPNGQRVPLSARIQTQDGTGILKGGTGTDRLKGAAVKTGVGAGLGAALGTAMGPLSGGGVGRGAIYGTALGAGLGALGSAWQKGQPAVINASQPVNLVLDQPLTVSPSSSSSQYGAPMQNNDSAQPAPYNFYGN
jgi:hypothetical protein